MTARREFLDPAKSLVSETVGWLAPRVREDASGAKSLAHILVVVPTAQSARSLRLALARAFAPAGVLPPVISMPRDLLADGSSRVATKAEELATMAEVLLDADIGSLKALFPRPPAERGPDWALDMAGRLLDIETLLGERAMTMDEVVCPEDAARWRDLASVEKAFFSSMEAKGVIDPGSLPVLMPGVKQMDPGYFNDFWTKPGYAGADPTSSSSKDRIHFQTKVKAVHQGDKTRNHANEDGQNGVDDAYKKQMVSGNGAYLELEELPQGENLYQEGLYMTFQSGEAQDATLLMGKMMRFTDAPGGIVTIGDCYGMSDLEETLNKIKPGDEILLDNSDYIALQSYYRHQVPADPSFHAWDQFRNPDGTPKTPQRKPFPVPFTGTGVYQDGDIQGKVINIQALMDESTCPWCADWWRNKIIETKGTDENHRTYFMERCMHGDINAIGNYMVVNYVGALRQALIDLSAWVEKGIAPLNRTAYTLGEDGQIHTEPDVSKRFGIQGIPTLKANGEKCAHVKVGECVRFTVDVEVPQDAGDVTEILFAQQEKELTAQNTESNGVARLMLGDDMWDGKLAFEKGTKGAVHTAHAETIGCYDRPGTYFATVRIATNRRGESDPFTQVLNLDRARIIVEQ